jgi:CRISPR system Cascade subunit CasD
MPDRDFLVFRLQGPMAAYGEIAVGERRSTWSAPSKSAVLGLLAAGLGLDRAASADHAALDRGLGFAVRLDQPGRPLRDYHTAMAPKARKGARWRTRKEELEAADLNTVLSERTYLVDPISTVALWCKSGEGIGLAGLADTLRRPRFTPYLGRKACPLGAPPRPIVASAADLDAAFAAYDETEEVVRGLLKGFAPHIRRSASRPAVWVELDAGLEAQTVERRVRRDGLMNRGLWQFTDRAEGRYDYKARIPGEVEP